MQIHVIQPGQSIFGIAQAYNTTAAAIVAANEVPNPDQLVVGQTLVIPIIGSFYWVQPGDTLFTVGQRLGVNYLELARVNNLQHQTWKTCTGSNVNQTARHGAPPGAGTGN